MSFIRKSGQAKKGLTRCTLVTLYSAMRVAAEMETTKCGGKGHGNLAHGADEESLVGLLCERRNSNQLFILLILRSLRGHVPKVPNATAKGRGKLVRRKDTIIDTIVNTFASQVC